MTTPVVVVGGSVASLVAADALAAAGREVEVFLPERGIGGGFLPMPAEDRLLDLGPRVLELRYDDASADGAEIPPWSSYEPGPHGHRPFLAAIHDLVDGLAGDDLVEVASAATSIEGHRCSDYVLAGDLSGLAGALDDDRLAEMAVGARAAVDAIGPHGAFAGEGLPWDRTFDVVGREHAGRAFHDLLIEPLAAKILPGGGSSVAAILHRKIWLPLFHPITAWEACVGSVSYRPDRPFVSVAGGGMGEVVRRLLDRMRSQPSARVRMEGSLTSVGSAGDVAVLGFASGATVEAVQPILGVGSDELFAATDQPFEVDRVPASMVWIDVPDDDVLDLPSVLFAAEPDLGVFRVTESLADRRPGFRTVCVEVACSVGRSEWEAVAVGSLTALGVASPGAAVEVVAAAGRPAFAVPSQANRSAFDRARSGFDALGLPVRVVGGPTAFAVDSFNEQVVQGLAAAAERG